MRGAVRVSGIRFHAFHGLTRLERQVGVRHRVDVVLHHDIGIPAASDRVEDTVDYRSVHDLVVRVGRQNSFHLIETLAVRLARELLREFPVPRVEVVVHKETPVLDGMVDDVAVEVEMAREEVEG